jgi:hypothetical protein
LCPELIEYQTEDYSDDVIREQQRKLNKLYDEFTAKYGLLSSRGNNMAFSDDSSYCLLCSLEILDEDGNLERKADMFTNAPSGSELLLPCRHCNRGISDLHSGKSLRGYWLYANLTGLSEEQLIEDLEGVIFAI